MDAEVPGGAWPDRSTDDPSASGQVGFKTRDITDLLTLYGVTDEQERSRFLDLTVRSGQPDWWTEYSEVLPGWFETYLGLESASLAIRSFEIQFVYGLFQTDDYARAVTRLGHQAPGTALQGEPAEDRSIMRFIEQVVSET
jgi:hypothetical protein